MTGPDDLSNESVAALLAGLAFGVILGWSAGVRLASQVWRHILDTRRPPADQQTPDTD